MVNGIGDINYTLWDSSVGKALYRMGKHGTRTGESYKGTVITYGNKTYTVILLVY